MGSADRKDRAHHQVDMKVGDRRQSMSSRPGSASSSDLSSVSGLSHGSGGKSSAPKVAAVVIVSLAIVAVLVGVTVYLIDMEREKQELERAERIEEGIETEVEFAEAANAFMAEEGAAEVEAEEAVRRAAAEVARRQRLDSLSQRRRFLENFQSRQEDFLRPSAEEEAYISRLVAGRRHQAEQGGGRVKAEQPEDLVTQSSDRDTMGAEQVTGGLEFGGVGLFSGRGGEEVAVTEREELSNHRSDPAAGGPAPMTMQAMRGGGGDIYDMAAYVKQAGAGPRYRGRPALDHRRLGEQGGEEEQPAGRLEPGLANIDRRPGRPMFHHQGPAPLPPGPNPARAPAPQGPARVSGPQGPARVSGPQGPGRVLGPQVGRQPGFRRRLRPQALRYRQQAGARLQLQQAAEVRQGRLPAGGAMAGVMEEQQEQILSNFDTFLKVAGGELGALRSVARNITESGADVNLWEILSAVNETVRRNPDSSIAQLMGKFEAKYLSEDGSMVHPAEAVYERSLSSLLFLSMGIFLLNSVNELVSSGKLGAQGEARSLPTDLALANLVQDSHRHEEVFALFNSTAFDFFDHEDGQNLLEKLKPTNPATTVNSYVRLLMNLVNAYIRDGSEFECIYAAYCYEVNQQARVGGMASSVAKINSVGLRLAMRELRTDNTVAALARSLVSWQDLPCQELFPTCDLGSGTLVEHS